MKRILILFLLIIPSVMSAQYIGIAGQFTTPDTDKLQFTATMNKPYLVLTGDDSPWILALGSGLDYTTPGPKISGLNVKPISFWLISNSMDDYSTWIFRLDGGYNYNLAHGHDGVTLSPNVYVDISAFYLSGGYEYNLTHKEGQFFVRVGVGLTLGLLKKIVNDL